MIFRLKFSTISFFSKHVIIAWIYLAVECGNTLIRGREGGRSTTSTISTTEIDFFQNLFIFLKYGIK